MFKDYDAEIDQLTHELGKLCWYMRGSLSWHEAYELDPQQRKVLGKVVEENIETVKKTKLPLL